MALTDDIADFIMCLQYDDIPSTAIEIARFAILDTISSAMAGSQTKIGKLYVGLCKEEMHGQSTIWGTEKQTSLSMAAFINASCAQILDYDDTQEINSIAVGHPGPGIVPLALTLGEKYGVSGKEILKAVILGYEMCMRFSLAIEPRDDSYFGFSNSQIIGAVTAASVLLGLNKNEIVNAIGLAVSVSPVANTKAMWSLEHRPMSWIKDGVGFVAITALMCSKMALSGFQATRSGLDEGDQYYKLCGAQKYDCSKMLERLGSSYLIEKLSFKPYPTCRFMQSTLDVVGNMVRENNLQKEDISKIEIHTTPYFVKSFDLRSPQTIIDAEFSLPYAISMIITGNEPSPKWYEDSILYDKSLSSIMDIVELVPDEAVEKSRKESSELKPSVKIILKSSRILIGEAGYAKGHPKNPFTPLEHEEKFIRTLNPYCDQSRINIIKKTILDIENNVNVRKAVSDFKNI